MSCSLGRPGLSARRASSPGFSLIELMVAMAMASLLVIGLANAAHVFSQTVREVRDEDDHRLEEALIGVTDAVRSAWLVERPTPSRLELTDALGRLTVFRQRGTELMVMRPNGARGPLLEDVASVEFLVESTPRYVEAPPASEHRTLWAGAAAAAPVPLTLRSGESLALGFSLPLDAPPALSTVPGVDEQVVSATLERLVVALGAFASNGKEFCHLHAAGPPHDSNHPAGATRLALALHEARVPGDPRPYGLPLATLTIPTTALPQSPYDWVDLATGIGITPPEVINPPAGVAWGWWALHPTVALAVRAAPAVEVPIDLMPLAATLKPGRAYALVLRVVGSDSVTLSAQPLASAVGSSVALRTAAATSFLPQALSIPFRLEGLQTCTQTVAHELVSRVTAQIRLVSGESLSASASVAAQAAVSDPWTGPVPDAIPSLRLASQ